MSRLWTRGLCLALVSVLMLLVLSSVAFAATQVNVSIRETVNQNKSYAHGFNLEERFDYEEYYGEINVTNPTTEPVFDVTIKLVNIKYMKSNFSNSFGRFGQQIVYPDIYRINASLGYDTDNGSDANLLENKTLVLDLDEDGSDDKVWLNTTHLIFNLSSENQLHAFILNDNGATVTLGAGGILNMNGTIISHDRTGHNLGVDFANFTIYGSNTNPQRILNTTTFTIRDSLRKFAVIHIPELRPTNISRFSYNISDDDLRGPLDINTSYSHGEFQTKVLAGHGMNVTDVVSNVAINNYTLWDINISIYALGVEWNNSWYNFTVANLTATGDHTNVTRNGSSDRLWYWAPLSGQLMGNETANISYRVKAPESVPTSATYKAVQQNLSYKMNYTFSNLTVEDIRAISNIEFNVTKEILQASNNETNFNVTWGSKPAVQSANNISYTIELLTVWVTNQQDPNLRDNGYNTSYFTDPTNTTTIFDNQSYQGHYWKFNYTDGTNGTAVPIVWMKPYYTIDYDNAQLINSSITTNGNDTYIKSIYVIHGYWLEVKKNVTDLGNNVYNISTFVKNRGNGHTPQNFTVTVYDFVPENFVAWNYSVSPSNSTQVSGEFIGTSLMWDIGLRTDQSSSFSPDDFAIGGYDEWNVTYKVNGSGDFSVSELYIVGLDPRQVDGANTSPLVTVISSIATNSRELVYLGIVIFLVVINVGNFMMTSRINRKLQ